MKRSCSKCGTLHEIKGKQYLCNACKKKMANVYSKRNREAWWDIVGRYCDHCGNEFPTCVMDMHHRDPTEKLFGLGHKFNMVNPDNCSLQTKQQILLEVKKCDTLCANCHRIHHDQEGE